MDYKETIKERLKILSEQLKVFVLDENWRREAEKIGKQFNFNEEKYASFENEIFLVLLCFEPKADFAENIKRELEIDANMAGWIAEDADKNIFKQVSDEINSMWQAGSIESTENLKQSEKTEEIKSGPLENQTQNGVGTDFEQIILNQARAMQPAREAPINLPTGEQNQSKPSNFAEATSDKKAIHNYVPGADPYREPAE